MSSIPLTEAASTGSCSFSLARITCSALFPAFYNAVRIGYWDIPSKYEGLSEPEVPVGFVRSKPGHSRVGMTKQGALHAPVPMKT